MKMRFICLVKPAIFACILLLSSGCDNLFPTKVETRTIFTDSATAIYGNRALQFTQLGDYMYIFRKDSTLRPAHPTVEVWIRFDTLPLVFNPIVSTAGVNEHNAADGFTIKYERGMLIFRLAMQDNLAAGWGYPYTVVPGQWVHFACAFTGERSQIFVNGTKVVDSAWTTPIYYGDGDWWVGLGYSSDFGGYGYFPGTVDELRVWDYPRTEDEIRSTMSQSLSGREPGLVGYWNFNQDTTWYFVVDRAPKHNYGILFGVSQFVSSTPF